jgi:hypothetical protein
MAARPQLPGMRWFFWTGNTPLRIGVLTWIYVFCAFVAWQLVDYGVPQLERFDGARDFAAFALLILLLLIPVFSFHNEPAKLFTSGLTAWTLLTLSYVVAETLFSLLETRMGAVQIFMLGAVSYGLIAVFHWVFLMCAETRHRHVTQTGNAASHPHRSRTR